MQAPSACRSHTVPHFVPESREKSSKRGFRGLCKVENDKLAIPTFRTVRKNVTLLFAACIIRAKLDFLLAQFIVIRLNTTAQFCSASALPRRKRRRPIASGSRDLRYSINNASSLGTLARNDRHRLLLRKVTIDVSLTDTYLPS